MQPVIRGPTYGSPGAVKHREERQYRARERVKLQGAMSDRAMIANGRADTADPHQRERAQKDSPPRQRE